MTTVFPEARVKKYIEMRGADVGDAAHVVALPAFWVGLMYDDAALDAAWDLVRGLAAETRQGLRVAASVSALQGEAGGVKLIDLARAALGLSHAGLAARGQGEAACLAPLVEHLKRWAASGEDGLLFPAVASGGHMKHGALYKVYRRARKAAGRPDLRWHDLRHTGATLAAQTGATLAELMNRLGHSDVRAALIYQHAAADRDAEIARRLSAMAEGAET